jgi:uncharacterized membrane protein
VAALAAPAGSAIGPERTVDIANKALSPAINDPTTAVLALDQIHRLLLYLGRLRAMLEHLDRVLPDARRGPLQRELELLHQSVERDFSDKADRAMAAVSDNQGVGGSSPSE